jgi:hypothetical protein
MNALAIDHHPQIELPRRKLKLGLEAADLGVDRCPLLLGSDRVLDPGPPTEGHLNGVGAASAGEQLEQILLEKCGVHAEFERQRAPHAPADLIDQLAHEGLGALAVVNVARAVLEPKNLPGLREMCEQRVVARVLGVMGVEAAHGPGDLAAGADHSAVDINRQSSQIEAAEFAHRAVHC